jgi:hypothetical protein
LGVFLYLIWNFDHYLSIMTIRIGPYLNLGVLRWTKRDNEDLFILIVLSLLVILEGNRNGRRAYFLNGLFADLSFGRVDAICLKDIHLDRHLNDNRRFLHFQGDFKYFCCTRHINGDLIDQWFHFHLDRYLKNITGFELNRHLHQVGLIPFDDLYFWQ